MVDRAALARRSLERLFREYVGIHPKWVIQRYRIHDAAAALGKGDTLDLARLALDLGYADRAHFGRDFKSVVGRSPSECARAQPLPEAARGTSNAGSSRAS